MAKYGYFFNLLFFQPFLMRFVLPKPCLSYPEKSISFFFFFSRFSAANAGENGKRYYTKHTGSGFYRLDHRVNKQRETRKIRQVLRVKKEISRERRKYQLK